MGKILSSYIMKMIQSSLSHFKRDILREIKSLVSPVRIITANLPHCKRVSSSLDHLIRVRERVSKAVFIKSPLDGVDC